MDDGLNLSILNEADYEILLAPWQHTSKHLISAATRARTDAAMQTRTELKEVGEIDTGVPHGAIQQVDADDEQVFECLFTFSAWSQAKLLKRDSQTKDTCPHCAAPDQDIWHTM